VQVDAAVVTSLLGIESHWGPLSFQRDDTAYLMLRGPQ
jgi:hypothetical protein